MRLWNRNEPVIGGWYFVLDDGETIRATETGLRPLVLKVESRLRANKQEIPSYLAELIEDQVCMRQPKDKCRPTKGLGDLLSQGISIVAGAVDKVAGTNLKEKAKGCRGCGKRRTKMNALTTSR